MHGFYNEYQFSFYWQYAIYVNPSLDALVKNLSEMDFKYLRQEFTGDLLEFLKQKGVYPYEFMNSFKRLFDEKLPDSCKNFIVL